MSIYDRRSPRPPATYYLIPLLVVLVVAAAFAWRIGSYGRLWSRPRRHVPPRAITPRGDLAQDEKTTIELFRQASPSVVHITTLARFRSAFSLNLLEIPQGTGSGIVWDLHGHIVTNDHVIVDADAAKVTLADNSTWRAKLVGRAPSKDLAVIRIDAPAARLHPIPVGQSSDLQVGQKVFAIGNPFGLDHTLTTGVISALGREIQALSGDTIKDVIQTDAAINPGNSGGPLLDSAGRLIGVNTQIYSPSGAFAGIGFAIPVDTVNWVVAELIGHGRVARPGLGVTVLPDQIAHNRGLTGVLIMDVMPGSAAEAAGLRPTRRDPNGTIQLGDLIVAIDGKKVDSFADLRRLLGPHKVGDTVVVTVQRDGQRVDVPVKLQALD